MIGGKIGLSVLSRMVNRICATEQKILVLVKYLLTLTLKSIQAFKQNHSLLYFHLNCQINQQILMSPFH